MANKPKSLTARFWAKGTVPQTAIHVPGGRIAIPGAKTDKGIASLITRAVASGTIRVESRS